MDSKKKKVADDMVVSLAYELKVDGEILDSSEDAEPIQFIQGQGHIVQGLESELYGMQEGESRQITVGAAEGYGELDPSAVVDVPRSEFPPEIPLNPGVKLQMRDRDGDVVYATIQEVGDNNIKLNLNHELAGKELHFDVTVVSVRPATDEELAHGHVHEHGSHH